MRLLLSQKQDTPKGSSDSGGGAHCNEVECEYVEDFISPMKQGTVQDESPEKTAPNNFTAKSMIKGRVHQD